MVDDDTTASADMPRKFCKGVGMPLGPLILKGQHLHRVVRKRLAFRVQSLEKLFGSRFIKRMSESRRDIDDGT
jgi:hypothetical protein